MDNLNVLNYIVAHNLFASNLEELRDSEIKTENNIYLTSFHKKGAALFCICRDDEKKAKCLVMCATAADAFPNLPGQREQHGAYTLVQTGLTHEAALFLRQEFPFTAPQALKGKDATIGTGDRLGLANPAHVKAVQEYDIFPVLAQQSIRELNFTKRTYHDVLDAATFAVFQEGYNDGFGFDGDHLKRIEDINMALDCGATMITLDLSDVMNTKAADWTPAQLQESYAGLPADERVRFERTYLAGSFTLNGGTVITFDATELQRCCAMYLKAIAFGAEVYQLLVNRRGAGNFDYEISIDETTTPTVPQHHLFITQELIHHGVVVDSLAPRFIGEFQKAIDYIGDLQEFERQLKIHCDIARTYGNYKVSIHSGSDKFSVYPAIGKWTAGRLHVKTAGTSWLEAVRVIAFREPKLYRKIHQVALDSYQEALKFYHITADFTKVKPLDSASDAELPEYLNLPESRQLIHIIYGFVLQDPALREEFYQALYTHEDLHYALLREHIGKHVKLLGRAKKNGKDLLPVSEYMRRFGKISKPWAEIVADSVLATYPDVNHLDQYHPAKWTYQNGFFLNALYVLWQQTKRPTYLQYITDWVNVFIDENGTFDPSKYKQDEYNLDNILAGRLLLSLYQETKQDKYKRAAMTLDEQLRRHPRTSEGGYWHKKIYPNQMWLDGIYMAEVFSVEFGQVFQQPEHFDEAVRQITLIYQHTHDPHTGLLYHGWDETKTQVWAHPERGTSPEFWGRAIGWYVMAIVDCLDVIPANHPGRPTLIQILQQVAGSLAQYQHPGNGMWYQILDKATYADNWPETSCTAMFAYTFAKGVRKGYLDPSFRTKAERAYQALLDGYVYLDPQQRFYLTETVSVGSLRSAADYEYYVTTERRTNDFKGVAAFLYASLELAQ